MRRIIPWLLPIAALLATAHAATLPDYPFVYVTGEAQTRVPPDVAEATFTVQAEERDAAFAERTVESRVADVLQVLHAAGVSDDRIDASSLSKESVTSDGSDDKPIVIRGYRVSREFSAKVTDLKKWPQIATHLLEAQNFIDVQVAFSRSDARSIDSALLERAAKDARERAQRLAISFGRHAGVLMAIHSPHSRIWARASGSGSRRAKQALPLSRKWWLREYTVTPRSLSLIPSS